MGRKRKIRKELPERVYYKHSAYYFVTPEGKWVRLDSDFRKAMTRWAEIIEKPTNIRSMGDVIDRYMMEVAPLKAPKTYKDNLKQVTLLREVFGHMTPTKIRAVDVYGYLDGRSAPVAANREIALLSHMFTKAIRWGVVEKNPCEGVERNKEHKRDRLISDAELKFIRDNAPPLIRCMVNMAYVTGQRMGDLLRIQLQDITNEGLNIKQGKTGKKLCIKLTAELEVVIADAKALRRRINSFYLFSNRRGQKYTEDGFATLWQRWKKKMIKSGTWFEDLQFRDLRAKAITEVKKQGGDPQLFAGHESADTTKRYIRDKDVVIVEPLKLPEE